jgi:hypothetical protein
MTEAILGEPYDDSRIGANQVLVARPWSEGGPCVFHSPWWLAAHWGRAFEIVEIAPAGGEPPSHGVICLRKDDRPLPTIAELERPEPNEPREARALQHNVEQLKREIGLYESRRTRRTERWARTVARRLAHRLLERRPGSLHRS